MPHILHPYKSALLGGRSRVAQIVTDLRGATALPAILTLSRAGNAMLYDSTGKLTYAPANMLLNSATLSTQTVTVAVGVSYIVSFQGTGSITLSGAASATINGTGASDRVYQKVSATTTSLVCTVSGTVTSAQVEPVTYQTTPGPYVATTSSAYYGPRFDYNPSTLAAMGLLVEATATNYAINSEAFDTWTANKNTVTANDAVSPAGTTTAERFTASAAGTGNCQVYKTAIATGGSGTITASCYFKKGGTSNGWVALACGDGTNYYTVSFNITTGAVGTSSTLGSPTSTSAKIFDCGNGWYRCSSTLTCGTGNKELYIIAACTGDGNLAAVVGNYDWAWGAQIETGTYPTSYIPTAAASVSRAAETANAADYSTQPAVIQYRNVSDNSRARKSLASFSSISSESNIWIEQIAIYASGTPSSVYNQFLTVDGPF